MLTLSLAPNPKWYFLDAQGRPAAGGTLTTWRSDDHSTPRFVYSDVGALHPYTDPIVLDATGGTPVPMYWDVTTAGLYYIQVKDAAGNLIFSLDHFPIIGGGGITPINNNVDIENHLINGAFLFIDAATTADSVISPTPGGTGQRVAPAAGFFKSLTGQYLSSIPNNISGWRYMSAGGAGETSSIRFVDVTNIGEGFPNAPSANATRYFRYQLSAAGTAQTAQQLFQVMPGVETFSGELLTITFDIRSNFNANGSITIRQFFGTGASLPNPVDTSQNFSFATAIGMWTRLTLQINVPTVIGRTKGTLGDDSVDFIFNFPLNTIGTFEVTNLQLQRGNFGLTDYIYQTYNQDQYKVLIDLMTIGNALFHTGELKWMSNAPGGVPISIPGWLVLANSNIPYIGSATSGAGFVGEPYKNLYLAWWNSFSQIECVVTTGRGVSAIADFNANKGMTIPRSILNTVLAGAGDGLFINAAFGFTEGERTHVLTTPELAAHVHGIRGSTTTAGSSGVINVLNGAGSVLENTEPAGNNVAHNNMQPTFYLWLYVKL